MTPQERIKADAEVATNDHAVTLRAKEMEYAAMIMRLFGYKEGYIAGATAEHDRAQVLVDALSDIASGKVLPQFIASMALEQWKSGKGKEVTDEEKYQQWIKENVTVLGEFDFLFANKRIYGKKELRRIYDHLTNPQQSK